MSGLEEKSRVYLTLLIRLKMSANVLLRVTTLVSFPYFQGYIRNHAAKYNELLNNIQTQCLNHYPSTSMVLYPKICPLFIHAYYWFYGYGIKVYLSSFFRLQVTFISSMDILRVFSVLKIGLPFCNDSGFKDSQVQHGASYSGVLLPRYL